MNKAEVNKQDRLIKAEVYNETSILLTFESGEQRVLDLHHLLALENESHLSEPIKERWKTMWEEGGFLKPKVVSGDLVFEGWVEIFGEDLKRWTERTSIYSRYIM